MQYQEIVNEQTNMVHARFNMSVLPLRGIVVLPHNVVQIDVGREKSINSINHAFDTEDKEIILVTQKDLEVDDPDFMDFYKIGTIALIKQVLRPNAATLRIVVEGICRTEVLSCVEQDDMFMAEAVRLDYPAPADAPLRQEVYARRVAEDFRHYASIAKKVPPEVVTTVLTAEDNSALSDIVATHVLRKVSEKQNFLETIDVTERLKTLLEVIDRETEIINLDKIISQRVHKQMEKNQKDYYLREQITAINKELGEDENKETECNEYREKVKQSGMHQEAAEKTLREIDRLQKAPSMSPDTAVQRGYIEWMLDLPWNKCTEDNLDINRAEAILNEDHYGLDEVKERILEYLAVCSLAKDIKGPILCLTGPPGVGKTSLAKSVARALERNFVRISLGGMRDEAEIRGHRRTYVASMPGRILENMKKAGTINPVFLLDEIDKLGNDYKGDPSSALLEVLDPEQNNTFSDHFIEVPYDLSKVLFITTANVKQNIPRPLLDRMEVIEISGYTEEEKLAIAREHLVDKQREMHAIPKKSFKISDAALRRLIKEYTREAGVRALERAIAKLCRVSARKLVAGESEAVSISVRNLEEFMGTPKYLKDKTSHSDVQGVVNGLAWTEVGGVLLPVEVIKLPGTGKVHLTGQLGDVMKESAETAWSYVRSIAGDLGMEPKFQEEIDLHVHCPEGAVPKDGPSAGVTMVTAMVSCLTGQKVRGDIAMTGEITLTGRVLPIGGVKEKVLAAYGNGIKTVLLPEENESDLEKIPSEIRSQMTFIICTTADDVLKYALR